jgi:SNF2 family DNA or RNA helicase
MEKTLEEHGWTLKDLEAAMLEPWSPLKDNNNKSINHENMTDKENVDKNLVSLSNHMNKISLNAKVTDSKEHFISNISEILNQPLINGWSLFDHQREAILDALKLERLILAYDMGLGKTCIGLIW